MPDRYAVGLRDWTGKEWDFTRNWAAGIKSGGVEDLVGGTVDTTAAPLGAPGQLVLAQRGDVVTGSVTFHCRAAQGRDAGQVAADLRRAFSPLIQRRSLLKVGSPFGVVDTLVRRNGKIPAPVEDPSWDEMVLNLTIPLISDSGVWYLQAKKGSGTVEIFNDGDVPLWGSIRWSGAGGVVRLPSRATFTLPPASAERVIHLTKMPTVVDAGGVRDDALWEKLRGVMPEMVPVGETREFAVPAGAQIEYRKGVFDPWQ